MALAPGTNCITQYEDRLIETIADCDAFQTFVSDLITPRSRVHIYDIPEPVSGNVYGVSEWNDLHPYCLVAPPEDGENFAMISDASGGFTSGVVYDLKFEKKATNLPYAEELRLLVNSVGDIVEELQDRSRVHGLGLDRMAPIDRPEIGMFNMAGQDLGHTVFWTWQILYRADR